MKAALFHKNRIKNERATCNFAHMGNNIYRPWTLIPYPKGTKYPKFHTRTSQTLKSWWSIRAKGVYKMTLKPIVAKTAS